MLLIVELILFFSCSNTLFSVFLKLFAKQPAILKEKHSLDFFQPCCKKFFLLLMIISSFFFFFFIHLNTPKFHLFLSFFFSEQILLIMNSETACSGFSDMSWRRMMNIALLALLIQIC